MKHQYKPLSEHYVLNEHDVYVGRGSRCFNHEGNRTFRQLIQQNLDRYIAASNKYDKSAIINEVVAIVRHSSPCGAGFVKKDAKTGRFYEVGDFSAREKTSQAFRDAIQEKSKQSNNGSDSNKKRDSFSKLRNETKIISGKTFSCPTLSTQAQIQLMSVSASNGYLSRSLFGSSDFEVNSTAKETKSPLSSSTEKIITVTANKKFESLFDLFDNSKKQPDTLHHSYEDRQSHIMKETTTIEHQIHHQSFKGSSSFISQESFRKYSASNVTSSSSPLQDYSRTANPLVPTLEGSTVIFPNNVNASVSSCIYSEVGPFSNELRVDTNNVPLSYTHNPNLRDTSTTIENAIPALNLNNPNFISSNTLAQPPEEAIIRVENESTVNLDKSLDDENTFNILLRFTEAYPNLENCPFIKLDYD